MCAVMGKWKHAKHLPIQKSAPAWFLCAGLWMGALCATVLWIQNHPVQNCCMAMAALCFEEIQSFQMSQMISQIFLVYPRGVQVAPFRSETCCCREVSSCFGYPDSVEDTVCFSAKQGSHLLYRPRFAKLRLGNFVSQPARELRSIAKAGKQYIFYNTAHILHVQKEHTHYVEEQRQRSSGVGRRSPYSSPLVL